MYKLVFGFIVSIALLCMGVTANAAKFDSTNYSIDGAIGNSFGGSNNSSSYTMTSTGGDSIIGEGTSGSYRLGEGYIAQQERAIELTVQPSSQELYFPFDEEAGTVAYDASANRHIGTFAGAVGRSTGKVGNALNYATSNLSVNFPQSANTKPSAEMTLEAWIRPSNVLNSNAQTIVSTKEGGGYALYLTGLSTDVCTPLQICFVFQSGGSYQSVALGKSTVLSNGTWAHLAATYDGSAIKLYVDGVERASTVYSGTITHNDTNAPFCIGNESTANPGCSGTVFAGDIDEVKLFSRGLTADEVSAEYTAGNAGVPSGLTLGSQISGVSKTTSFRTAVNTDASAYSLSIHQNQDLTSGGNSIPAVAGSIGTPLVWDEGTTQGLGFSLFSTNATALPGKWGSGNAYAALPTSASSFYNRVGGVGGSTKDVVDARLRLGISASQPIGNYSNQMMITGTITP
jgi:predicted outer membrane protein